MSFDRESKLIECLSKHPEARDAAIIGLVEDSIYGGLIGILPSIFVGIFTGGNTAAVIITESTAITTIGLSGGIRLAEAKCRKLGEK